MANGTMELIQTVTVGAGGQAAIDFLNIPATYDDLYIVMSARSTGTNVNTQGFCYFTFNSLTTSFTSRRLIQDGTTASSDSSGGRFAAYIPNSQATTGTFGTMVCYIPNYRSSNNKSYSTDQGMENNSSTNYLQGLVAGLWSNTSAITSISIGGVIDSSGTSANFAQHTTATLYGITRVPAGAKATGGVIYDDSSYWYHVFTSSGTFTPSQSITADVLVIAGGGSGGYSSPGGGGAGGLLAHTNQSLTATSYTVTVGSGGAATGTGPVVGNKGSNSQFGSLTLSEGGGAGGRSSTGGGNGGSGGGGGETAASGGTATTGQGNNGGAYNGGGGGAGQVGAVGYGSGTVGATGLGGDGVSTYSSWGLATNTGENISGTVWYAGGGGGYGKPVSGPVPANGGKGGGGAAGASGVAGLANSGAGSGADSNKSAGSGIVIVRYAK